jgi:hypothetical protein
MEQLLLVTSFDSPAGTEDGGADQAIYFISITSTRQ